MPQPQPAGEPTLVGDAGALVDESTLASGATLAGQVAARHRRADPDEPPPRLGHYVLLDKLGQGGMGTVHSAYDPKLDRKVAIKLLHARGGEQAQVRLVREAQALARLSHPNVVQIYEIAELDEHAFLVMEFVEGVTLREWLRGSSRSQAEILARFDAAGRGLAAAHAEGLIHRDFKPDNVMVRRDGRVLVMDFGLARGELADVEASESSVLAATLAAEPASPSGTSNTSTRGPSTQPWASDLTRTGALLGTPAYMAPEQYRGREVTARSDQFAFCVALWEALVGQRPFVGRTLTELMVAITSGTITEPASGALPAWLRKLLVRGLATDAGQRWPTIDALLDALRRDPTRRRRGAWIGLGVLALSGSLVGGWALTRAHARGEREAACEREAAAIVADFGAEPREAVARAFRAAAPNLADAALEHATRHLDAYASEWSSLRLATCVELELEGTLDAERAAPMLACLDERRADFVALVESWRSPSRLAVAHAASRAAGLEPLSTCRDPVWLAQQVPPPDDPSTREAIAALELDRRRVDALALDFAYDEALVAAKQVLREAEAIGWLPLVARARAQVGDLELELGHYDAAREALEAAYLEAGRAGDDLQAITLAISLARLVGYKQAEPRWGMWWISIAEMTLARLGLEGTRLDAIRLGELGVLQDELGDYEAALASYDRKRAIDLAAYGPQSGALAVSLTNRGLALVALGRYDEALVDLEAALAIRRALYGPHHTLVAAAIDNLGVGYYSKGELARALAAFREALPIWEAVLGPDHVDVAASWSNIGMIEWMQGNNEAALAASERALVIRERVLAPDHPDLAASLTNIASVQGSMGRFEAALANHRRALALRERAFGPDHPKFADTLAQLASTQLEMGAYADALPSLERVLAIRVAQLGAEHPDVVVARVNLANGLAGLRRFEDALAELRLAEAGLDRDASSGTVEAFVRVGTGEALVELGRHDEAQGELDRVLELVALEPAPEVEARARFGLGKIAWAQGREAEALDHVRAAQRLLADLPADHALRREHDTWLAAHEAAHEATHE